MSAAAVADGARIAAVLFWQRLDQPGHDACTLWRERDGAHRLEGQAVFAEAGRVCRLQYTVRADAGFATRSAEVRGAMGRRPVQVSVRALRGTPGRWAVDGVHRPALDGCLDVDLGFTPATNLLVMRRLALRMGGSADAPAAYLDFPSLRLRLLPQRYRRVAPRAYDYESPAHGYRATLVVDAHGAAVDYPGVFRAVDARAAKETTA